MTNNNLTNALALYLLEYNPTWDALAVCNGFVLFPKFVGDMGSIETKMRLACHIFDKWEGCITLCDRINLSKLDLLGIDPPKVGHDFGFLFSVPA